MLISERPRRRARPLFVQPRVELHGSSLCKVCCRGAVEGLDTRRGSAGGGSAPGRLQASAAGSLGLKAPGQRVRVSSWPQLQVGEAGAPGSGRGASLASQLPCALARARFPGEIQVPSDGSTRSQAVRTRGRPLPAEAPFSELGPSCTHLREPWVPSQPGFVTSPAHSAVPEVVSPGRRLRSGHQGPPSGRRFLLSPGR